MCAENYMVDFIIYCNLLNSFQVVFHILVVLFFQVSPLLLSLEMIHKILLCSAEHIDGDRAFSLDRQF